MKKFLQNVIVLMITSLVSLSMLGANPVELSGTYLCTGTAMCKKGDTWAYCSYSNWNAPANSSPDAIREVFKDCAAARNADPSSCKSKSSEPINCNTQNSIEN